MGLLLVLDQLQTNPDGKHKLGCGGSRLCRTLSVSFKNQPLKCCCPPAAYTGPGRPGGTWGTWETWGSWGTWGIWGSWGFGGTWETWGAWGNLAGLGGSGRWAGGLDPLRGGKNIPSLRLILPLCSHLSIPLGQVTFGGCGGSSGKSLGGMEWDVAGGGGGQESCILIPTSPS